MFRVFIRYLIYHAALNEFYLVAVHRKFLFKNFLGVHAEFRKILGRSYSRKTAVRKIGV